MAKARHSEPAPIFNENESPLYRLFFRRDSKGKSIISEFQFAAGERLRVDYERANFEAAHYLLLGRRADRRAKLQRHQ